MMYEVITQQLQKAEVAARELAHQNMQEADYDQARRLLDYAQAIHSLCASIEADDRPSLASSAYRRNIRRPSPVRASEKEFPKYFIASDRLVKLGRSRQGAETPYYTHETPRPIYESIMRWMRNVLAHGNGPWPMRDLELALRHEGIPSYHAYNVAGALREANLLELVGRGAYQLDPRIRPDDWWDYLANLWPVIEVVDGEVRCTEGEE